MVVTKATSSFLVLCQEILEITLVCEPSRWLRKPDPASSLWDLLSTAPSKGFNIC